MFFFFLFGVVDFWVGLILLLVLRNLHSFFFFWIFRTSNCIMMLSLVGRKSRRMEILLLIKRSAMEIQWQWPLCPMATKGHRKWLFMSSFEARYCVFSCWTGLYTLLLQFLLIRASSCFVFQGLNQIHTNGFVPTIVDERPYDSLIHHFVFLDFVITTYSL